MTYFIIYIILVFLGICELSNISSLKKKTLYWFSFCILVLLAGLRYETGGDWTSYTEIFNSMEPIDEVITGNAEYFNWSSMEVGYKLLNSICKFFINNVQLLFLIVAMIISTILFLSVPKYSPLPQLSILVYFGILFFALDMIVIRQGIAVVLVFASYYYVQERKFWKVFLLSIIGSMFHLSALILIPLYFLLNKTFSSRILIALFIVFNIILLLGIRWFSPILETSLTFVIDPQLASKLTVYLTSEAYAVGRGITFGFLVNSVSFIILIINRKRLNHLKFFNLFFNLFILYLFVYCCMSELVEIGNRLKYYFMISFIVLLPMVVYSYYKLANRIILYSGLCIFSFMYGRSQFLELPIASAFNPYQNYLIYYITDEKSTGLERLEKSDDAFSKERGQ